MPAPAPAISKPKPQEPKSDPIPVDAPPIPIHPRHGQHSALYRYGTAFYVARYDLPDGKEFGPWTWRNNKWANKGYGDGKPLYRAEDLAKHSTAQVLIVEGEKCADVAAIALRIQVVVSWCGGAKAVKGTDWSALYGRDVVIWPDADKAGRDAAADIVRELGGKASRVRVMNLPEETAEGWDVADAIGQGMEESELTDFMAKHLPSQTPVPAPEKNMSATSTDESAFVSWSALGLDTNEGGLPHATLANASLILRMHPKFRGHVWYDIFTQKVYQDFKGIARQWRDEDDEDLTVFIQQSMKLNKFKLELVRQGVRHAARARSINSLTDWLDSLKWNGVEHLDTWLTDTLGVDLDEHTLAVSRKWPISMVARAYQPGCQVDTMPVLEGVTGLSKSSFVNALGSPWYASLPEAFGAKDFLQAIQGRWLIEIPDMTGFSHREHTHILATLSNRTDVYRASYGHHVEEHPRSSVFAATSETEDYLQDIRGRRRYWPLRCKHIDIDVLRGQREQLFAQAVHAYRAGEDWWKMPGKTDQEQRDRALPDIWSDKVLARATEEWDYQQRSNGTKLITSADLLELALDVKPNKQGQIERNRIARIMREGGWIQSRTKDQRHWIKPIRADPQK
jgi:predicted P-loop ATPase